MLKAVVSGHLARQPESHRVPRHRAGRDDRWTHTGENQGSDVSGRGISGHRPHLSVHRRTERSTARAGSKAAAALAVHLFLAAQGGCEPQLTSHAHANMRIGNDRHFLITVASQCMPYIGYPRTLNALRCVDEAANSM